MGELKGQEIRGYVIHELIAMGGFAAIYRAHQLVVEREVAIKVILPKYANNPEFVRRFEAEAQLIARLDHLHIVPLYDYWREPNNAYLVMRWLRGGTLLRSIQRHGAWALPATARLLDQITSALAAAHQRGIIHQDLTPANILLDEDSNAYLADFGIARDLVKSLEQRGDQPIYGSLAYIAPERVKKEPVSPQTDIYSLGVILYQVLTGDLPFDAATDSALILKHLAEPIPLLQMHRVDLPEELNSVIRRAAAKEPEDRYPTALSLAADFRRILSRVEGSYEIPAVRPGPVDTSEKQLRKERTLILLETGAPLEDTLLPPNPYKGLRSFDEADAGDFFGRDVFIQRLLMRLAENGEGSRFLAVVGPSGSGKSSVVKAGLIPRLRRGVIPGSDRWFITKMIPGAHPLKELETALLGIAFDDTVPIPEQLHAGEQGLGIVTREVLPDAESQLLLVIDQFEELFTLVDNEAERAHFLKSLFAAVTDAKSQLRVIITLRADFYDRPLLYPGFGELVREHTEVVLPLSPGEIQEAILNPAQQARLILESDLVAELVSDVTAQPGTLPLLQYAMTELFEQRQSHILTLAGYQASGGVLGSLTRRAEEIYSGLEANQQEVTRQLFLRLISLGEGVEETRRRVHWSELMSMGQIDQRTMQTVLDTFGKFRLLTFDRDPATREPTVEVAHEALLRQWERLRAWLTDNRENLLIQRRLALSTEEWIKSDRQSGFLAGGARLAQFEKLVPSASLVLTSDEQAYLKASIALRQRAAQRRRLFITLLAVFTIVSLSLAVLALDRQNRAQKARREAERSQSIALTERDRANVQAQMSRSRELAMAAITNRDQTDLSLLLSVEAFKVAETLEARDSLLTSLQSAPYLLTFLHDQTAPVRTIAFSPDGTLLASGSRDGTLILWDVAARQLATQIRSAQGDRINTLAFSPDGRMLATGGDAGEIQLWDVRTGQPVGQPWSGHTGAVWSVAFSPDGTTLASGSADNTIRLWEVETGSPSGQPLAGHTDFVYSVAFSPDGTLLASGGADNTIRLWNTDTGDPVGKPLEGHTDWVWSVAFSPDGRLLASGSADDTVRLWDVKTGRPVMDPLAGHTNWVRSVTFSRDGTTLISGGADDTVRVWDVATGQPVIPALTQHHSAVWSVAFNPDGHTVASGSEDTKVILWDLQALNPLFEKIGSHQEVVFSVVFSPDGQLLASAGGDLSGGGRDNAIRLWDVETGTVAKTLAGHSDTVSSIAFSPDGQTLASASYDRTIILWDVESGLPLFDPLTGHQQPITSLVFSPDGQSLVSGSDDQILLWDLSGGQPVNAALAGPADAVTSLAFSPDGTLLASGSRDNTMILWDTTTMQPVRPPLTGHSNWVLSVSFSPDGSTLASGSRDNTIILWDLSTGRPIGLPLKGHSGWVMSVAFSPNGQTLASGSTDTTVAVWKLTPEFWQEKACAMAHRNLSAAEQERFFGDIPYTKTCPALP